MVISVIFSRHETQVDFKSHYQIFIIGKADGYQLSGVMDQYMHFEEWSRTRIRLSNTKTGTLEKRSVVLDDGDECVHDETSIPVEIETQFSIC